MKWIYKPKIETSHELMQYGPLLAQLLFSRGVVDLSSAKKYLNPRLEDIPDASLMPNINKAVDKIIAAIKANKTIYIYGDYDVDGICASSILFDYLYRFLNAKVIPYIPNRFEEGYGLNEQALDYIQQQGGELVITVDCGIRDSALVKKFIKKGLDFVVTDHHALPEEKLSFPAKVPVVHPGVSGSEYPNANICATNVAWKLVDMLERSAKSGVNIYKYLDVVGLATVCDVMPLTEENRIVVKYGLDVLKKGENIGLFELLLRNNLDFSRLDSYHYGFIIGPRLNAAGRMEDAMLGLKLLTSKDKKSISLLASKLETLNKERQMLTMKYLEEAEKQAKEQIDKGNKLIVITGDEWNEGIIGLVAGKLTEKYGLPVIATSKLKDSVKGSARSVNGFNITEAISTQKDKLHRFGGHTQAAGFTAIKESFEDFVSAIQNFAKEKINLEELQKVLNIDTELDEDDMNVGFAQKLDSYRPFGYGNVTPIFSVSNVQVINSSLIGKESKHFKMYAKTKKGKAFEAIAFNRPDFSDKIKSAKSIDIAASLEINSWNGQENLQLNIKDIKSEKDKE